MRAEAEVTIRRELTADKLNQVVNHPSVYDWVRGNLTGKLDMTPVIADPANYLLMGDHGGVMYHSLQPGLYEGHTQVLPEGRGVWAIKMARLTIHWMFTRTDAVELITRVPFGNLPAKALTMRVGGELEFSRPGGWMRDGKAIPADIYSLTIQRWLKLAPGLIERGAWFNRKLTKALRKANVVGVTTINDENCERYVGAAVEMILHGYPGKGVVMYNRWASMAGYSRARMLSEVPCTIEINGSMIIFRDNDFWVAPCL